MTKITFTSKDPKGLLCVLGEASIEFANENAPQSMALIDELRDQLRAQVLRTGVGPSDFDRANMADESARLDEANALEDARPVHHDHVSLAVVLRVLDGVREASITATEQEAVRRCHNAVMSLPTYVGCWP